MNSFNRRSFLAAAAIGGGALLGVRPAGRAASAAIDRGGLKRYEYVFTDGDLYAYDMDADFALVRHVPLPMTAQGIKGVCASAHTSMLYVAYGGDGGQHGHGSMLKYDLVANRVLWTKDYSFGIDSMAISPTGRVIYMPAGEASSDERWHLLDALDGRKIGEINGGRSPHNTIVGPNGRHVYLGARNYNYLLVADMRTRRVIKRIGPLQNGVRPFTINGKETLAFTTATEFLGFQVSSLVTGKVLHTVTFPGFSWDPNQFGPSCPSHGISLSPGERTLYVLDAPNENVHVFDVQELPRRRPEIVASIKVHSLSGSNRPCGYDCEKIGWINQSRDGRFVFVAEAGDVIDARTRLIVKTLPTLANTRKHLEVDFDARGQVAWAAPSRSSVGYLH